MVQSTSNRQVIKSILVLQLSYVDFFKKITNEDRKPSNLLMDKETGELKLSIDDFGLSCSDRKKVKLLRASSESEVFEG